ncbi:class I SAM-dependent methyltransferase [Nocardia terpenica]|uniref:Methyltransferase type 11 n=2 Tax=Nocardia terpenica TaxID=455432 RepID=A0A291RP84_9NOCA|nr:class I SAM-dependent methyltransferase [Nocardia terpenica]ATL69396.1 methyltransferase type 11 [Nocardia terpenica]
MMTSHNDRIREQFRLQAPTFENAGFSNRGLAWIVEQVAPRREDMVLDVAAGAGHLGRALAPLVSHVSAIDLTPEMLVQGRRLADESGLRNIAFCVGDAVRLPWLDRQFDLVVCRLALHQVADPAAVVREMVRVTRPDGRIGITDMFVPAAELADETNRLERLRDPSHNRTLAREEILDMVENAGAEVVSEAYEDFGLGLDDWLDRTRTPDDARAQILSRFTEELDGGPATGLAPSRTEDGGIRFIHPWITVTATPRPGMR